MYYVMEPLDSFFFRGSVPFEEGGETIAVESMFPPLPSVYAGAFRRLYYLNKGAAGQIQIGFNGLVLDHECLFPMPADLFWCGEKEQIGILESMALANRSESNYPLDFCLIRPGESNGKDKELRRTFLTGRVFENYLNAEGTEFEGIDLKHGYLSYAPRIGIEIDTKSRTAKEHQFYQITEVRPAKDRPLKLIAQIKMRAQGKQWDTEETAKVFNTEEVQVIKLGGEGKLAAVRRVEPIHLPEAQENNSPYFKLYLATPAIFEKGWLPGWLDKETCVGTFTHKKRKVRVKLISAAVGRPVSCGGFGHDAAGYHPKELRFAVPGGSVYYFKLLQGTYADVVKLFHGKCISDYREGLGFTHPKYDKYRYCDRGFGFALVGKLGKEQEEKIHAQ